MFKDNSESVSYSIYWYSVSVEKQQKYPQNDCLGKFNKVFQGKKDE